jgi:diguanylate cyclase (GGDEF)-like protein
MTTSPFAHRWIILAVTALTVFGLLAVTVLATVRSGQRERADNRLVLHTYEISDTLWDTLSHVQDAETGQRGHLLTGSLRYLVPFDIGRKLAPADLDRLQSLTRDNAAQQAEIARLRPLVNAKLAELAQTVTLARAGQRPRALLIVNSNRGQALMERIRSDISRMQTLQSALLSARMAAANQASDRTLAFVSGGLALVVVLLGGGGGMIAALAKRQVKAEEQIRDYTLVLEFQKRELEKANDELALLAITDGLTGLHNHRRFQETLLEEVSRADRYGALLSLVVLDVDNFKQYNDAYGHPAGDVVLQTIAGLLQHDARDTDLIARYGGEEFVLLLPETDLVGAAAIAERLRMLVEDYPWPERAVTASFGVACLRNGQETGADLIDRGDKAMYRSKIAGRSRVMCAPHETVFRT